MTLEELDSLIKENRIEVVKSLDSKTFLEEVLGIKKTSQENKRRIKSTQDSIPDVMAFASDQILKNAQDIDYSKVVKDYIGINYDDKESPLSILKKQFLEKFSEQISSNMEDAASASSEIKSKVLEDLTSTDNNIKSVEDVPPPTTETPKSNIEKVVPAKEAPKSNIEKVVPTTEAPKDKDSILKSEKLDTIIKLLSPGSLRAGLKIDTNFELKRLYHEETTGILRKLLFVNREALLNAKNATEYSENMKKSKTAAGIGGLSDGSGTSGGGLLTSILTFFIGARALGAIKSIGTGALRLAPVLLKIASVLGLVYLGFEALKEPLKALTNKISVWLGYGDVFDMSKKKEGDDGKTVFSSGGASDEIFQASVGGLMASRAIRMFRDPDRAKTIRDAGRNINVKSSGVPFSPGAGRSRQAVGRAAQSAYETSKTAITSRFKPPVPPPSAATGKLDAFRQAVDAINKTKEAKVANQAAKLVPDIAKSVTATKEAGVISKALTGIKGFASGIGGKIAKMTFGTVATGVLGGLLKRIPIISGIYELYMAYVRYKEGDYKGVALRLLSASSNLLYLLGPQMAFLQIPLSWYLSYLDESDQPTESGNALEGAETSSASSRVPVAIEKPNAKKPPEPRALTDTEKSLSILGGSATIADNEDGIIINDPDAIESPSRRMIKLNPTQKEPSIPLSQAIPAPISVVVPQSPEATAPQNVQNINNVSTNNSTTITQDPIGSNRLRARWDYRYPTHYNAR